MTAQEIDIIFKEIFDDNKCVVKSIESVFEKDKDALKLVISIHQLTLEDSIIIHTKFIFRCDLEKVNITEKYFNYLYDINCIYHKIVFSDLGDLKNKIMRIIESNKFGKDLQIISEFIDTPIRMLNNYFDKNNIRKYNVIEVKYEPKFKIQPCNETTFDFDIDISGYIISLTISKKPLDDKNIYKFCFKIMDIHETIEVYDLTNMHFLIGGKLVEILDKIIK
jgi:hypothetical protein